MWEAFFRAVRREKIRRRPLRGTVTHVNPKFLWPATSVKFSLVARDRIHRSVDTRLAAIFPLLAAKVSVDPPRLVIGALNACPIIGACSDVQVTVVNGHRHDAGCIIVPDAPAVGPLVAGIVPVDMTPTVLILGICRAGIQMTFV